MSHSCQNEKWSCPICKHENVGYISFSTITSCSNCKASLSWSGDKVITYDEWLKKISHS